MYACFNLHGGSSPRAWGTQQSRRVGVLRLRFIPTRVGNTMLHIFAHFINAVHPHARGEHIMRGFNLSSKAGSSPRAWGTLLPLGRRLIVVRFIPTRVGNTHG